jgi:GNAT superfamily N-acetyltransferase
MTEITLTETPAGADVEAVLQGIISFNLSQQPNDGYQPLGIFVTDDNGAKGGLSGWASYDWLYVQLLHLPPSLRGQGVGTAVMRKAEDWSRARGLTGIWLDTFEFQARGFYEKLGFQVFGTIEDHPKGRTRYFMRKRFDR